MGNIYWYFSNEEDRKVCVMTKKQKIAIMFVTLTLTIILWIFKLISVITFFFNPMSFNFTDLILCLFSMFVILGHWAFYVSIMNDKNKRLKTIVDVDNWWEKWDRV